MAFDYFEWKQAILEEFGMEDNAIEIANGICALRNVGTRTIPSVAKIAEAIVTDYERFRTIHMREWNIKFVLSRLLGSGYLIVVKHGKGRLYQAKMPKERLS